MKKLTSFFTLLLAIIFVVSFAACQNSETPNPSATVDPLSSAVVDPSAAGNTADPSATEGGSVPVATVTPRPTFNPNATLYPPAPENALIVTVENVTVKAGETFSVNIEFDNSAGWTWSTFESTVNFDSTKLKMVSIKNTELTAGMMSASNPNLADGKAKVVFASGEDLDGSGPVCKLEFEALTSGTTEITLTETLVYRFVTADGVLSTMPIDIELVKGTITIE